MKNKTGGRCKNQKGSCPHHGQKRVSGGGRANTPVGSYVPETRYRQETGEQIIVAKPGRPLYVAEESEVPYLRSSYVRGGGRANTPVGSYVPETRYQQQTGRPRIVSSVNTRPLYTTGTSSTPYTHTSSGRAIYSTR
jgi:hypothetical protein